MTEVKDEVQEEATVDTNAEIRQAFDDSIEGELSEDEIKMAMIASGATFKNVTRLYNEFMIDAGLAVSKADRDQLVTDTLEGRSFDTEETFDEAIVALTEAIQGSTERSAAALIRSYAKKNELDVYAKPKSQGASRNGFRSKFYRFLIENPAVTEDEAKAFINGEGEHEDTSDNVKKKISTHLGVWKLVNTIYNSNS